MSVSEKQAKNCLFAECIYVYVEFKVLPRDRQAVRKAKSTDKQYIFPSYAKHFFILVLHCRRKVDATQSESVSEVFKSCI